MPQFSWSDLWDALRADLASGRDAFVRNMQRASGGGILSEGETDTSARGSGGDALAGAAMVGSMPASAPAGALRAGSGLLDLVRGGRIPDVPQTPLPRYDPPRGVSERAASVLSDPAITRQVTKAIDAGLKEGGADWYWTEPLRRRYVDTLGEPGNQAFRDFMGYVAATSPQSKVPKNIQIASYYDNLARRGEEFSIPREGSGFGSKAQNLHLQNANNYRSGSWDPLQNPKPISFSENLAGNWAPATVDTHAVRLPTMLARDPRWLAGSMSGKEPDGTKWKMNPRALYASGDLSIDEALKRPGLWDSVPSKNEYGAFEKFYTDIGRKKGLTPAETQAAAWVGGRHITGMDSPPLPFLSIFDQVLVDSAAKQGMSPGLLLDNFIRGQSLLR